MPKFLLQTLGAHKVAVHYGCTLVEVVCKAKIWQAIVRGWQRCIAPPLLGKAAFIKRCPQPPHLLP